MDLAIFVQFLLTFISESIVIWLFLRKKNKLLGIILFTFLINLFTWPLAQLLYGEGINFFVMEIAVVFVESLLIMLLFKLGYWKALLISFAANLVSASFGWLF